MDRSVSQPHDHRLCIEDALAAAERLSRSRGQQMTAQRRRVLELVWSSHAAIKAYDIIARFNMDGPAAKPPTVYRALDFLLAQGFIHRIESLNAYAGCPHPDEHDECGIQLLVCDDCRKVEELHTHAASAAIRAAAETQGFSVDRTVIEVHGLCPDCQKNRKQDRQQDESAGIRA